MNTPTFALLLTALVLATACSTPYDLKRSRPLVSYTSQRPAEEVKKCIYKKWDTHLSGLKEVKTETGWMIQYTDSLPSATKALVTIDGTEEAAVNYFSSSKKLRAHRLENDINDCR